MKELGTILGVIFTVVLAAAAFGVCCVATIVASILWVKIVALVLVVGFVAVFTLVLCGVALTMGKFKK